jgi:hypothetical protein
MGVGMTVIFTIDHSLQENIFRLYTAVKSRPVLSGQVPLSHGSHVKSRRVVAGCVMSCYGRHVLSRQVSSSQVSSSQVASRSGSQVGSSQVTFCLVKSCPGSQVQSSYVGSRSVEFVSVMAVVSRPVPSGRVASCRVRLSSGSRVFFKGACFDGQEN